MSAAVIDLKQRYALGVVHQVIPAAAWLPLSRAQELVDQANHALQELDGELAAEHARAYERGYQEGRQAALDQFAAATAALLVSISGVIAMMIPYAAEIYPVHLRGTGSGVIAASSKFGGILGAGLGVLGFFEHFAWSALLIAVPMAVSGIMLWRNGIETRGQGLEDIQQMLARPDNPD